MTIPNLLAERYAGEEMIGIWTPEAKIRREREFWITVMEAQRLLGVDIPEAAAVAYRSVVDKIDFASIRERERRIRHDVVARLEEFCELAGYEHIHRGLTSRDLTENVEQAQIRDSLNLLLTKSVAVLDRLALRAEEFANVTYPARTHNVPAQATTVGRLFAVVGEELLWTARRLESFIADYPLRGLRGPVGTQAELLILFGGDETKVDELEQRVAESLGFGKLMGATGQVYPRSLDFAVASAVFHLVAPFGSFATTLRLMSGTGLAEEGFSDGQVGSSAMPHKINARSCERICALSEVVRGYVNMAAGLAGRQWYEGDVSCSAVRRVLFPDLFFAADGILETQLSVLEGMRVHQKVAVAEMDRMQLYLASSTLLAAAQVAGVERSVAHSLIQLHIQSAAAADGQNRSGALSAFTEKLSSEEDFPLSGEEIQAALAESIIPGRTVSQVRMFIRKSEEMLGKYPASLKIKSGTSL